MNNLWLLIIVLWSQILSGQENHIATPPNTERVEIPDAGFSIVPPQGWEVIRNAAGSSLLFRGPKQEEGLLSYQGTIQVMVFQGGRYIDEFTEQEFGRIIVDKFSAASNRVSNYRLRSQQKVKLENGDDAILYYTELQIDEVQLMQMHILMSSATQHFLLTYTDFAKYFEQDNSKELAIAFTAMHSATLDSQPPSRYYFPLIAGGTLLGLVFLGFSVKSFRAYRMKALSERLEEEDGEEVHTDAESRFFSQNSRITPKRSKDIEVDDVSDEDEDESANSDQILPPSPPQLAAKRIPFPPSLNTSRHDTEDRSEVEGSTHVQTLPQAKLESDVARLSDILPRDGSSEHGQPAPKKAGFFKRKEKSDEPPRSIAADDKWPSSQRNKAVTEVDEDDTWAIDEEASTIDAPELAKPKVQRSPANIGKAKGSAAIHSASAAMASQVAPLTEDAWNLGQANDVDLGEEEDEDDRL